MNQQVAKFLAQTRMSQKKKDGVLTAPVRDRNLRQVMIKHALSLETQISNGKMDSNQQHRITTSWGLIVIVRMRTIGPQKPLIYTFEYRVSKIQFESWVRKHDYLVAEGPLAFTNMGINVLYDGRGPTNLTDTMFTIANNSTDMDDFGDKLDLLSKSAWFECHRDPFSKQEWIVNRVDYARFSDS